VTLHSNKQMGTSMSQEEKDYHEKRKNYVPQPQSAKDQVKSKVPTIIASFAPNKASAFPVTTVTDEKSCLLAQNNNNNNVKGSVAELQNRPFRCCVEGCLQPPISRCQSRRGTTSVSMSCNNYICLVHQIQGSFSGEQTVLYTLCQPCALHLESLAKREGCVIM
jgi:hypothetical protein